MIKIYDGRNEFYQWDLNRKLIVDDTTVTELHFCNKTSDCSLVVAVRDGIADVPNILLQTDWTINVYAYCGDCYTKEHAAFKVNRRSKPDDYVYTETEVMRWEALEQRVNTTLDSVAEAEQARNSAELARATAENERNEAEQTRADEFETITAEANGLIGVLDDYYVPTVDNHEIRLTNLERHISNDYFFTDETTEYNKLVPVDACPYAEVDKVGGMTYKCNNLIPFPYYFTEPTTAFGVTWTPNADGSITANGTQTSSGSIGLFVNNTNPIFLNGTYSASLGATLPSGCNLYLSAADGLGNVNIINASSSGKATITNRYFTNIRFLITSGAVFNNVTFYPMLNEGSTALPYEPYFEGLRDAAVSELKSEGADNTVIDTFEIAEEIQALDGYGIGKSETEYNYIDFERKVFKQDYGKVRLLSTLGGYNADSNWYYISFGSLGIAPTNRNVLCNLLPCVDLGAFNEAEGIYHTSGLTHVTIRKNGFTTANEYKQWLADNEVYIIEKLAEPIETDISAYLGNDSFIEVEGGGSIRAINEYNNPAPTSITYLLKEGSI